MFIYFLQLNHQPPTPNQPQPIRTLALASPCCASAQAIRQHPALEPKALDMP